MGEEGEIMNKVITALSVTVILCCVIVVFADWLFYTIDTDIENWIYTFYKTYPELQPISCELAKKKKLSWLDKKRFHQEVKKIQKIYDDRRKSEEKKPEKEAPIDYKRMKQELLDSCDKERKEMTNG